jgi:hypothetical protein
MSRPGRVVRCNGTDEMIMTNRKESATEKNTWETPTLAYAGRVDQLVQGGTGKVTVEVGDPGEPKKVDNKG